jgi:hypothetical protein
MAEEGSSWFLSKGGKQSSEVLQMKKNGGVFDCLVSVFRNLVSVYHKFYGRQSV